MTGLRSPHSRDYTAGIDLGSTTIKVVLYDGEGYLARMKYATWDPAGVARDLLCSASREAGLAGIPSCISTTGYGRRTLAEAGSSHTEITCHARGASYLVPGCRFVIDIGGQDAKGIRLTEDGSVGDFVMNDKCAAGTGRFLSTMGQALGVPVDHLSQHALGKVPYRINAMCTVFAESEVISLVNQGISRDEIIAGIHASIARRTVSMIASLHPEPPVVFTGGVSQNADIAERLSAGIGHPVIVPEDAVFAGALGAALLAWENRDLHTKAEGEKSP
jgi:(R)-2-hydroxyacyl-CoA dehydratese activating ATPase